MKKTKAFVVCDTHGTVVAAFSTRPKADYYKGPSNGLYSITQVPFDTPERLVRHATCDVRQGKVERESAFYMETRNLSPHYRMENGALYGIHPDTDSFVARDSTLRLAAKLGDAPDGIYDKDGICKDTSTPKCPSVSGQIASMPF